MHERKNKDEKEGEQKGEGGRCRKEEEEEEEEEECEEGREQREEKKRKKDRNYFLTSPIMKRAFFLFKSVASSTLLSCVNCTVRSNNVWTEISWWVINTKYQINEYLYQQKNK